MSSVRREINAVANTVDATMVNLSVNPFPTQPIIHSIANPPNHYLPEPRTKIIKTPL